MAETYFFYFELSVSQQTHMIIVTYIMKTENVAFDNNAW